MSNNTDQLFCKKHKQTYRLFCGKCYWDAHPDSDGVPIGGWHV